MIVVGLSDLDSVGFTARLHEVVRGARVFDELCPSHVEMRWCCEGEFCLWNCDLAPACWPSSCWPHFFSEQVAIACCAFAVGQLFVEQFFSWVVRLPPRSFGFVLQFAVLFSIVGQSGGTSLRIRTVDAHTVTVNARTFRSYSAPRGFGRLQATTSTRVCHRHRGLDSIVGVSSTWLGFPALGRKQACRFPFGNPIPTFEACVLPSNVPSVCGCLPPLTLLESCQFAEAIRAHYVLITTFVSFCV